eukprot:scaffold77216_cov20-Tisochrysis_lutea.AAC.2
MAAVDGQKAPKPSLGLAQGFTNARPKNKHMYVIQDSDAAYLCCCDYTEPACVIVKHTNPCGVAVRGDLLEAYRLAVRADPISAFGGIVAFNREVTAGAPVFVCVCVRVHVCAFGGIVAFDCKAQ